MTLTVHQLTIALFLGLVAAGAFGAGEDRPKGDSSLPDRMDNGDYFPVGVALFARALKKCGSLSDMAVCLKKKAVTILDRALHSGSLVVNDYLTLSPEPSSEAISSPALTEAQIEAGLPTDAEAKETALDEMISEKVSTFIKSRSLKFNTPVQEEGRVSKGYDKGYKKGGGSMMMMGMAMGGMMIQVVMAKIALLAGKALLIGKLALLLSAIIGLKKLVSNDGGESHHVVYAEHGGGHGWGRSYSSHDLAYAAHAKGDLQSGATN